MVVIQGVPVDNKVDMTSIAHIYFDPSQTADLVMVFRIKIGVGAVYAVLVVTISHQYALAVTPARRWTWASLVLLLPSNSWHVLGVIRVLRRFFTSPWISILFHGFGDGKFDAQLKLAK